MIGGMLGQMVSATTRVAVGNAYVARPDQGGRQMDQHASDRIRATSGWRSMLRTSEGGGGKTRTCILSRDIRRQGSQASQSLIAELRKRGIPGSRSRFQSAKQAKRGYGLFVFLARPHKDVLFRADAKDMRIVVCRQKGK